MVFPVKALPPAGPLPIIDNDKMKVIFDLFYCDMPYIADLGNGNVVVTGTFNSMAEGGDAQTIGIARSSNFGRSFSPVTEIEPASGPEASWVVPFYHAASGRLWIFYTYNYDNRRLVPNSNGVGGTTRMDSYGKVAYRYSTDGGVTWSARQLLNLPNKAIDLRNPFGGTDQLFWMYGRVTSFNNKLYMGFSKMGQVVGGNQHVDTEAFVLRLDIHPTTGEITNPLQLPSGSSNGLRNPDNSNLTEEPDVLIDPSDGLITVFSRTDRGMLAESWSTDGGATFTTAWATYADGVTPVNNPRGPALIRRMPSGRPLLWFYNDTRSTYLGRNPYWYALGDRVGNRIRFGTPNIFMFSPTGKRLNYGDCMVIGNELLITMTNKEKGSFTFAPIPA